MAEEFGTKWGGMEGIKANSGKHIREAGRKFTQHK